MGQKYECATCGVPVVTAFYGWKHCTNRKLWKKHKPVPIEAGSAVSDEEAAGVKELLHHMLNK